MSAMAAYEKSRIELDRATGTLLDHNGISIDDAAAGQSRTCPTFLTLRRARTAVGDATAAAGSSPAAAAVRMSRQPFRCARFSQRAPDLFFAAKPSLLHICITILYNSRIPTSGPRKIVSDCPAYSASNFDCVSL